MNILQDILRETKSARSAGLIPRIYFDLDSTLFNVKPRLRKIIQEFGHLDVISEKYPRASKVLREVQEVSESYHLREHLEHFGLNEEPVELHKELYRFWRDRFFHSDYLLEDTPNEGAVEYVNELHSEGAYIVYLTGRDFERMGIGSLLSLKKWNFPIETPRSELVLKPHRDHDDAEFKRDHFKSLDSQHTVWFFENEPHNIHLILKECPHVRIIYYESVHSGRSEPPQGLPVIRNFRK